MSPNTPPKRSTRRANRAAAQAFIDDPLLDAREAAAEAGLALSTWWKHVKAGNLPAPIYPLPHMPRWRRSVIRARTSGN